MRRRISWLGFLCSGLAACSSAPDHQGLETELVAKLPDGNAQGSAVSGRYLLALTTTDCDGRCPAPDGFAICEIGFGVSDDSVTLTQTAGRLEASGLNSQFVVDQLSGGINTDGSFDIGGLNTISGTSLIATVRATGTIDANGKVSGEARGWASGSAAETSVDCVASYSLTGQRK
ncbi:MAG: hypothetical protein H6707_10200 [Deltaproteobacteria bacterium]|nr:hypothetical protein [Deltaproteobacteria bacterium]